MTECSFCHRAPVLTVRGETYGTRIRVCRWCADHALPRRLADQAIKAIDDLADRTGVAA